MNGIFNEENFDKETIESIKNIAILSGSSISQISEALERLCNSLSESMKNIEEIFKDIEEIVDMIDTQDDIPALKKQIKYCKNPMEIKALNKRLNDAYKKKNKKR